MTTEFTVTPAACRPAQLIKDRCFYCRQLIGGKHKADCVLVRRKVTVRLIMEYDVVVPAHWTPDNVEFHRNESSWCADNLVDELAALVDNGPAGEGCLCGRAKFAFVRDAGEPYLGEG